MQGNLWRLLKDRGGNFGIMTAILLPVMIAAAGGAIDLTNVMQEKNRLQSLADSAALAAAAAMADREGMTEAEARSMAAKYVVAQFLDDLRAHGATDAQITAAKADMLENTDVVATKTITSHTAESYDVHIRSSYNMPLNGMTSLLGISSINVVVDSYAQSGREGDALSMYLALDESGSMAYDTTTVNPAQPTKQVQKSREVQKTRQDPYDCGTSRKPKTCYRTVTYTETEYYNDTVPNYLTKIASLKAAANVMFTELKKADPTTKLIRMGADSYTHVTETEEDGLGHDQGHHLRQ